MHQLYFEDPWSMAWLWSEFVRAGPAIVALVVGFAAAVIAVQQYRVAKAKLQLDLFEERYKVFEVVHAFCNAHAKGVVESSVWDSFVEARRKSFFLFGQDIPDFCNELVRKAVDLEDHRDQVASATSRGLQPEEVSALQYQIEDMESFFRTQAYAGRAVFQRYMNFSAWHGRRPLPVRLMKFAGSVLRRWIAVQRLKLRLALKKRAELRNSIEL